MAVDDFERRPNALAHRQVAVRMKPRRDAFFAHSFGTAHAVLLVGLLACSSSGRRAFPTTPRSDGEKLPPASAETARPEDDAPEEEPVLSDAPDEPQTPEDTT